MECIARLVCEVGAVREPPLHALHLISLAGSHPTIAQRAILFYSKKMAEQKTLQTNRQLIAQVGVLLMLGEAFNHPSSCLSVYPKSSLMKRNAMRAIFPLDVAVSELFKMVTSKVCGKSQLTKPLVNR